MNEFPTIQFGSSGDGRGPDIDTFGYDPRLTGVRPEMLERYDSPLAALRALPGIRESVVDAQSELDAVLTDNASKAGGLLNASSPGERSDAAHAVGTSKTQLRLVEAQQLIAEQRAAEAYRCIGMAALMAVEL